MHEYSEAGADPPCRILPLGLQRCSRRCFLLLLKPDSKVVENLIHKCQRSGSPSPTLNTNSRVSAHHITTLRGAYTGKRGCEIEDESLSQKNVLQTHREIDSLFCLCLKIFFSHFFCNGAIHLSSNRPLNFKPNRNSEDVRHSSETTKPPSITPNLCTNWQNIKLTIYFIQLLTLHNPKAVHLDSNLICHDPS